MTQGFVPICLVAALTVLAGCVDGDAVDASGAVYEGISEEATISVVGGQTPFGFEITPLGQGNYSAREVPPGGPIGGEFAVSRFTGNNGLGFSGELDGRAVHIAITPGECRDGTTERAYPFAATVAVGKVTLIGCAYTSEDPFSEPEEP